MKPITGFKTFFEVLDKIDSDLEAFEQNCKKKYPEHWGRPFTRKNEDDIKKSDCKPYSDNVHLTQSMFTVNGGKNDGNKYPCLFLWWTLPNYNGQANYINTFEKSEKKKILHSENGFDFCIIRDSLSQHTRTYWGYRFETKVENKSYIHKLALMKGDNVVFSCVERWEFEKYCTQEEQEERMPESPSEIFRYFNPFKVHIVPMKDVEKLNNLSKKFEWISNCPTDIYDELVENEYYKDNNIENKWVVILHGLSGHGYGRSYGSTLYYDRNATWWIMDSKTMPTVDDALYHVMRELDFYFDEDENAFGFINLLNKMKNEYGYDLNKINLEAYRRVQDLYSRKLRWSLGDVLGTNYEQLRKFWNENINY